MLARVPWMAYVALVLAIAAAWLGFRALNVELERSRAGSVAALEVPQELKELARKPPLPDIDTADFIDRPLFWLTRRPPEVAEAKPPEVVNETPAQLPPALKISGVVRDGDTWFIVGSLGPQALRLKTGEVVKGWTITEISPDNVIFTSGKKTATVKLFEPKPAEAAPKAKPGGKARKQRAPRQRSAAREEEKDADKGK